MNYYNVKYLKDGNPQGRPYAFKTELELLEGDTVELEGGKHGQVVGLTDMEMVNQYGVDRLKSIVKKVEEEREDK